MYPTELAQLLENDKIELLSGVHLLMNFSPQELLEVGNALKLNTSLKAVEIENTQINFCIAELLLNSLPFNNSIKSLRISNIDNLSDYIPQLKEVLNFCTSIEQLVISHQKKGDDIFAGIGSTLTENTNITDLQLINCPIEKFGTGALAEIIEGNKTLTNICVSHQALGSQYFQDISAALAKNKTLGSICLTNTCLDRASIEGLINALVALDF